MLNKKKIKNIIFSTILVIDFVIFFILFYKKPILFINGTLILGNDKIYLFNPNNSDYFIGKKNYETKLLISSPSFEDYYDVCFISDSEKKCINDKLMFNITSKHLDKIIRFKINQNWLIEITSKKLIDFELIYLIKVDKVLIESKEFIIRWLFFSTIFVLIYLFIYYINFKEFNPIDINLIKQQYKSRKIERLPKNYNI